MTMELLGSGAGPLPTTVVVEVTTMMAGSLADEKTAGAE
jgi:hypothetical protein